MNNVKFPQTFTLRADVTIDDDFGKKPKVKLPRKLKKRLAAAGIDWFKYWQCQGNNACRYQDYLNVKNLTAQIGADVDKLFLDFLKEHLPETAPAVKLGTLDHLIRTNS